MKYFVTLLAAIVFLVSCSNQNDNDSDSGNSTNEYSSTEYDYSEDDGYDEFEQDDEIQLFNGDYCAEVTYYNPNTGTESQYIITIEVNDNELDRINFPQGWFDDDQFGSIELDEDGYTSFTSDRGYYYTVQIIGEAYGCLESVPLAYQCSGITEEGDQCEKLTDNSSGYCWQHEN